MGTPHYCETCAKICNEAKKNVKKLEKKVQTLTIVCTASITLLGEQGVKALYDTVSSFNKVTEVANGGKESKEDKTTTTDEENKDKPKEAIKDGKVAIGNWKPHIPKRMFEDKEPTKPYSLTDELSRLKEQEKENKPEEIDIAVKPQEFNLIVKAATQKPIEFIPALAAIQSQDWRTEFLTPSTLAFDVFSTTIALGNNYGFGEYYGLGLDQYSGVSTPSPSGLSYFAVIKLFNNRKRTV
jgi:hypothetical protein